MIIASFDLATKTGLAVGHIGTNSGPLLESHKLGSIGNQGAIFLDMWRLAKRIITEHEPELISFEAPIAAGPAGTIQRVQVGFGLRSSLLAVAALYNVPTEEHSVSSIRKHFIGTGKSRSRKETKAMVVARCNQLGWKTTDDNEADAAAVWEFTRSKRGHFTPQMGGLFDVA